MRGEGLGYNNLGDDGSSPDRAALADGAAWQDDGPSSYPAVLRNRDASAKLRPLAALSLLGIRRQGSREDAHVGANDAVVANINPADVVDGAVPPDNDVVADIDVVAVIACKGRLDGNVPANVTGTGNGGGLAGRHPYGTTGLQNLEEEAGSLIGRDAVRWRRRRVVEAPTGNGAALALQTQLFVERIVMPAREHLLLLPSFLSIV